MQKNSRRVVTPLTDYTDYTDNSIETDIKHLANTPWKWGRNALEVGTEHLGSGVATVWYWQRNGITDVTM